MGIERAARKARFFHHFIDGRAIETFPAKELPRRLGGSGAGDPPDAWLMPLVGLTALPIAYLVLRGRGIWAWTAVVAWNVIGIWDAFSAYLVHESVPWSEFFMIEIFGSSMFFGASAVHVVCLWLTSRPAIREVFLGADTRGLSEVGR